MSHNVYENTRWIPIGSLVRRLICRQIIARRIEAHKQYVDAVRRGCTQDMHSASKRLSTATTAQLALEIKGVLSWLAR